MNTCDKCSYLDNKTCKQGSTYTPLEVHTPDKFGCIYFYSKDIPIDRTISDLVGNIMTDINNELETIIENAVKETLDEINNR